VSAQSTYQNLVLGKRFIGITFIFQSAFLRRLGRGTNEHYNGQKEMAEPSPIRFLRVEDHPVFRQVLASAIETGPDMLVVNQAINVVEDIAQFRICGVGSTGSRR
jgi:hypothetical protein